MNRLSDSTSLYLQQHADNPVDWRPWDEAALDEARSRDVPILLSIGYSACHWCHVMAHESFEDEVTAGWMNRLFVNIKVDREERPDLDRVYQLSHQLLTGRGGGWPLTVFLDPQDLAPFFAGTYFPPAPRHGLPAFAEVLQQIRQWYDEHRDQIGEQNRQLAAAVASIQQGSGAGALPDAGVFTAASAQLAQRYDARNGGFGGAPKFPQAPLLGLVQALSERDAGQDSGAAEMLRETLVRMAASGLRDHLDGGFFRYTVDGEWTIPHFEKMLYDNAMLLPLYAEAARRWEDPELTQAAKGIVSWLRSEMRHADGAFFASIDADADGEEGGFHVWQPEEVRELLDEAEYQLVAAEFGFGEPPNFEGRSWHLVRRSPGRSAVPGAILEKLRAARAQRVPPATDTKLLTSWNALCIEGLARAGLALRRNDWLDLACQGVDFLHSAMWDNRGLKAVHAGGKARFDAYLDDHAYLLSALLVLMQERCRPGYLEFATRLADRLLEAFEAPDHGGFCFTRSGQAAPIHRLRPLQDDATPAGNGVAARALLALGHLAGETRYIDAARRTLEAAAADMRGHPLAHAALLLALRDFLEPPTQVVVTGADAASNSELARAARCAVKPPHRVNCYVFNPEAGALPGILGGIDRGGGPGAYVCRGLQCLPPASTAEELAELLTPAT